MWYEMIKYYSAQRAPYLTIPNISNGTCTMFVWWPWLISKRVARFVSYSWVSCHHYWLCRQADSGSRRPGTVRMRGHDLHTTIAARPRRSELKFLLTTSIVCWFPTGWRILASGALPRVCCRPMRMTRNGSGVRLDGEAWSIVNALIQLVS